MSPRKRVAMCIENNSNAQAFLRWASSKLSLENIRIGDLDELVDGLILCRLLEVCSSKKLPPRNPEPQTETDKVNNLKQALDFLREEGVSPPIEPIDIVEGATYMLLDLLWQLILLYEVEDFTHPARARAGLLGWVNEVLADFTDEVRLDGFRREDFKDGLIFAMLVNRIQPDTVPLASLQDIPYKEALEKCFYAMEHELAIPRILDPEDFKSSAGIDEPTIMAQVALLYGTSKKPPLPPPVVLPHPNSVSPRKTESKLTGLPPPPPSPSTEEFSNFDSLSPSERAKRAKASTVRVRAKPSREKLAQGSFEAESAVQRQKSGTINTSQWVAPSWHRVKPEAKQYLSRLTRPQQGKPINVPPKASSFLGLAKVDYDLVKELRKRLEDEIKEKEKYKKELEALKASMPDVAHQKSLIKSLRQQLQHSQELLDKLLESTEDKDSKKNKDKDKDKEKEKDKDKDKKLKDKMKFSKSTRSNSVELLEKFGIDPHEYKQKMIEKYNQQQQEAAEARKKKKKEEIENMTWRELYNALESEMAQKEEMTELSNWLGEQLSQLNLKLQEVMADPKVKQFQSQVAK